MKSWVLCDYLPTPLGRVDFHKSASGWAVGQRESARALAVLS